MGMTMYSYIHPIRDIKLVKASFIVEDDDSIVHVFHYDTCILQFSRLTRKIYHMDRYSRTSSKMINRVLGYYSLEE